MYNSDRFQKLNDVNLMQKNLQNTRNTRQWVQTEDELQVRQNDDHGVLLSSTHLKIFRVY